MQPTHVEEAARSMADDVQDGEDVDREDAVEVRKHARELLRLVDGVTLASEGNEDADQEELALELHGDGRDVHEAVLELESTVLNEDGIEERDLEMVLGYVEELEQTVIEIAEMLPREQEA